MKYLCVCVYELNISYDIHLKSIYISLYNV